MVEKDMKRYYWIAGVVISTVLFSLIIIFALIMPSIESVKAVNRDLKVKKENLAMLEKKLAKLKELKVKEKELKDQEAIVNKSIPTKKEVGELFIQLEGIISDSGGETKGISEGANTTSSSSSGSTAAASTAAAPVSITGVNFANYGYEVTFESYDNFKRFLAISENSQRYIQLNSFQVTGNNDGKFVVSLNYKAYYRDANSGSTSQTLTEGAK